MWRASPRKSRADRGSPTEMKPPTKLDLHPSSAVIDIALAVAAEGRALAEIAEALHVLDRENDEMLWAAMS